MTKTRAEIDAEKESKPRYDLIPPNTWEIWGPINPLAVFLMKALSPYTPGRYPPVMQRAAIGAFGAVDMGDVDPPWAIAQVQAYGRQKHGKCTWREYGTAQADPETHYASMCRHLHACGGGHENKDPESGLPHLWHALAQACIIYDLLTDPPQEPKQ